MCEYIAPHGVLFIPDDAVDRRKKKKDFNFYVFTTAV